MASVCHAKGRNKARRLERNKTEIETTVHNHVRHRRRKEEGRTMVILGFVRMNGKQKEPNLI